MLVRRAIPIVIAALAGLVPGLPLEARGQAGDYDGAAAAGLELRRLGMTGRVLHIAAHPDDENTALLATLALGQGANVAYLSLTRGEGGQNSLGPELSTALGILRSGELLAARRLDGAGQFFTRAIDYGYSRSAAEALTRWPREELLADVVEVIRRYRPDVVVSVWSGTERDGHGQHQASGIVAREAVLASGDPTRYPEQLVSGLRPHTPRLYYRSAFFSERAPDVELNTGRLDPLLGRSYHQVAMASRALHRSQDQGVPQAPGPRRTAYHRVDPAVDEPVAPSRGFFRQLEGAPGLERSLFEGVDTLLSQRAGQVARQAAAERSGPPGRTVDGLVDGLREYEALVEAARQAFNPLEPGRVLPTLGQAQRLLVEAAGTLEDEVIGAAGFDDGAARDLHFHVANEMEALGRALLAAANLRVDAVADAEWVVPGQAFTLELAVWNGGPDPVVARAGPLLPPGWQSVATEGGEEMEVGPGDRRSVTYEVTVPPGAEFSIPYYLDPRLPPEGAMYRWPDDPELRGAAFGPGPVRGSFLLLLESGLPMALDRAAAWIAVDRRAGEYRRPVKVVPAASLSLAPGLAIIATGGHDRTRRFTVRVRRHTPEPMEGELRLDLPPGWSGEPLRIPVRLENGDQTFDFAVTPPPGVAAGEHAVSAVLTSDGLSLDLGFQVIDYPHIEPQHLYARASATVRVMDLEVARVRAGYVEGAGDGIPQALDRLGLEWAALQPADMATGDLDRFDVIITGIRAYEVRPDLVEHNPRLLDWVRRGGTLLVQYNQYDALRNGFAPWPVTIARPHGRVTDEAAPVTILEPDHPLFNRPNRIGPADWDGWVQERGLYFLDSWDGPLTPLLAMSDPGEQPLTGGLLVAPLGEGTWVYSGLALFRQLPQGVPGAYRLLANLLSLGASR
jgi:LmbE family N-acetylglucosaminyl deacetylase